MDNDRSDIQNSASDNVQDNRDNAEDLLGNAGVLAFASRMENTPQKEIAGLKRKNVRYSVLHDSCPVTNMTKSVKLKGQAARLQPAGLNKEEERKDDQSKTLKKIRVKKKLSV